MLASAFAVELSDVSKRYGQRWALSRLSLQLPVGASLLLTGHNGSGKTTLLRLLATAVQPTFGRLSIFGQDSGKERQAIRENVALLSHASFLYEDLTAEQNLMLLARLLGESRPQEVVTGVLERLGLAERAKHPVRQFSAGMRKRLGIARLLLKKPRLVLLDEPFGELDPSGIRLMEQLVSELAREATVVLATHLVEQGKALCQRHLQLENGRWAS